MGSEQESVRPPHLMGVLGFSATLVTLSLRCEKTTGRRCWDGQDIGSTSNEINEPAKILKLWVRRKRGSRKLICSGCGRKFAEAYDSYEREVRDLPCFEYRTTVVVELYRVRCPDCGIKAEKVPQLPSKAP